jgi:CTP-dependent riboflavin kinase
MSAFRREDEHTVGLFHQDRRRRNRAGGIMKHGSKLRNLQDRLIGRVASGRGEGQRFTQLEWAREQFTEKLGINPSPGTLNLIVDQPEFAEIWNRLKSTPGVRIDNPNDGPHDCDARCLSVLKTGPPRNH